MFTITNLTITWFTYNMVCIYGPKDSIIMRLACTSTITCLHVVQNIDCGYSLNLHQGDSNLYKKSMFCAKNEKTVINKILSTEKLSFYGENKITDASVFS